MQELDQLECTRPHAEDRLRLRDRGELRTHVVHAAARRADDVLVAGEILNEQTLRRRRLGLAAGVRHRLAAAGLVERIVDLAAEPFQQFERGHAHLGEEGVDVAGDEEGDAHADLTSLVGDATKRRPSLECNPS